MPNFYRLISGNGVVWWSRWDDLGAAISNPCKVYVKSAWADYLPINVVGCLISFSNLSLRFSSILGFFTELAYSFLVCWFNNLESKSSVIFAFSLWFSSRTRSENWVRKSINLCLIATASFLCYWICSFLSEFICSLCLERNSSNCFMWLFIESSSTLSFFGTMESFSCSTYCYILSNWSAFSLYKGVYFLMSV